MKEVNRVLVVYKKTTYQRYSEDKDERVHALLKNGDVTVDKLMDSHASHMTTMTAAREFFQKKNIPSDFIHDVKSSDGYDLVVTLGGDGTLLWTSHVVGKDIPMVAINSAPETSVGYFCAGTRDDVHITLSKAIEGRLPESSLNRMRVEVDGEVKTQRVLNDILFCNESPAATTRYLISHRDREEAQISSGIWIGPAAGSTAAQRSAGGSVLPIESRNLQFVVREPYSADGRGYFLAQGIVTPNEVLRLRSKSRHARIFVDGADRMHHVELGSVISIASSSEPLTLLGLHAR